MLVFINSYHQKKLLSLITEMAERHNVPQVLKTARNLALQLQTLIENK